VHPRSAWRDDVRCPFGCRQWHRRRSSTARSLEYYRSDEGKSKKRDLNERRKAEVKKKGKSKAQREAARRASAKTKAREDILSYVQMLTGMIEDRPVSREEIETMLAEEARQQDMALPSEIEYHASQEGEKDKSPP
jgi:hypothetical protein